MLKQDIAMLREKFPHVPIAIVSHGREEFSLTQAQGQRYGALQAQIRQLVNQQDVKVQVCGRFAAMNGVDKSEFPAEVEVVPRGPVAIQEYVTRGYRHIVIDD